MSENRGFRLCRLCLCGGCHMVDIFEGKNELEFRLEKDIQELLDVKVVKESRHPWLVCTACSEKLTDFRLYKRRCAECQIVFNHRVRKGLFPVDCQTNGDKSWIKEEKSSDGSNEEVGSQVEPGSVTGMPSKASGTVSPVERTVDSEQETKSTSESGFARDTEMGPLIAVGCRKMEDKAEEIGECTDVTREDGEESADIEDCDGNDDEILEKPFAQASPMEVNSDLKLNPVVDVKTSFPGNDGMKSTVHEIVDIQIKQEDDECTDELCDNGEETVQNDEERNKISEMLLKSSGPGSPMEVHADQEIAQVSNVKIPSHVANEMTTSTVNERTEVQVLREEDDVQPALKDKMTEQDVFSEDERQDEGIIGDMSLMKGNKNDGLEVLQSRLQLQSRKKELCLQYEKNTLAASLSSKRTIVDLGNALDDKINKSKGRNEKKMYMLRSNKKTTKMLPWNEGRIRSTVIKITDKNLKSDMNSFEDNTKILHSPANMSLKEKKETDQSCVDNVINLEQKLCGLSGENVKSAVYECDVCGREFKAKTKIGKHMKVHNKEQCFNLINPGKVLSGVDKGVRDRGDHHRKENPEETNGGLIDIYGNKDCTSAVSLKNNQISSLTSSISGEVNVMNFENGQGSSTSTNRACCNLQKDKIVEEENTKAKENGQHVERMVNSTGTNDKLSNTTLRQSLRVNHVGKKKVNSQKGINGKEMNENVKSNVHHLKNKVCPMSEKRFYVCDVCQKSFTHKFKIIVHMRTHIEVRPFSCSVCSRAFCQKITLQNHMRTHTKERPYPCSVCSNAFTRKDVLKTHMRTHTKERPYTCDVCFKDYSHKYNFRIHMRTHTNERPYECSVCPKTFRDKYGLTEHMRTHTKERPYACSLCSNAFRQKQNLTEHMRTHSEEKSFICSVCSKAFCQKATFRKHMKTHSKEKPYTCAECSRAFIRKDMLVAHITIHSGEKPYACPVCSKAFNRKRTVNSHMRTHTKERPFDCSVCSKAFSHKNSLNLHMITHTKERSHVCSACSKAFTQRSSLMRHMKKHA